MDKKIQHLLSLYAASTLDKQRTLMDLIGEKHSWNFSMKSGEITFNERHKYPVQIIGTESTESKTWRWAWANTESGIPAPLLASVSKLKVFGGEHHIDELKVPQIKLGDVNGAILSTLATGLTRGDAYYRGPYNGGALYVVINAPPLRAMADGSPMRLVSVFTQLISSALVDHRKAWKAYLEQKGYGVVEAADSIVGTSPKGENVSAKFDSKGRAIDISAAVAR